MRSGATESAPPSSLTRFSYDARAGAAISSTVTAERRLQNVNTPMLQALIDWYFASLESGGVVLVALLMAIESSIVPLPSEVVIPPAAYYAEQGRFHFWGVVMAATLGSWAGATISYWFARVVGRPLILR